LVTLASYIDPSNDIQIVDYQAGQTLSDSNFTPDLVALTTFNSQLTETDKIAQEASKIWKNVKKVAGGAGVTSNSDYASQILPNVDTLVVGDGEDFMVNLESMSHRTDRIIHCPRFDLGQHKRPLWNLIDYERYVKTVGLAVETSRGCPFNCIWCTAHLVTGKKWRPRIPESVVEELSELKERYNCCLFYFTDDNATVDPKRWERLMQLIIDARLNIEIQVPEGIQAHHLTYDALVLMKKAGFRMITIGAESGSQRVLDDVICKGGLKVEQIAYVVKTAREIGLEVNCFFVIGTVGETLDEAKETVEFAQKLRKLGAYSCMVRNAIPIQGTRMFKIAKEKGYLTVSEDKMSDLKFMHSNQHFLKTPEWNPEDIMTLVEIARKQDANHILTDKKWHLVKQGSKRLITSPRSTFKRAWQILKESI
jgi:magnesium-protoporphyrin IX monomethyl ester (oxidative) cyclase